MNNFKALSLVAGYKTINYFGLALVLDFNSTRYNYLAMDINGSVHAYVDKPTIGGLGNGYWNTRRDYCYVAKIKFEGDPKDSLLEIDHD